MSVFKVKIRKEKDRNSCLEETMEKKFGKLVSSVGKNAKNLLEKSKDIAIQAVDQNSDGKISLEDASMMAENVGNVMKKGAYALKEAAEEQTRQLELKTLQPIFLENLNATDFVMSKFIRIAERDKKYSESVVCKGSIGFLSDKKGLRIINIFRDSVDTFGLSFYPDCNSEFFYVDPSDRDAYIALDEYFYYLKQARISELQRIAQDLGAKHFKVTYKEEKATFSKKKRNVEAAGGTIASANIDQSHIDQKYVTAEIASEMEFPGHMPVRPKLKYLKYDPSINSLIEMRMNEHTPVLHQKLRLKLSNSSGIKENEAAMIDAVLKGMKCTGNTTLVNEIQNEARRYLEYEIDF